MKKKERKKIDGGNFRKTKKKIQIKEKERKR